MTYRLPRPSTQQLGVAEWFATAGRLPAETLRPRVAGRARPNLRRAYRSKFLIRVRKGPDARSQVRSLVTWFGSCGRAQARPGNRLLAGILFWTFGPRDWATKRIAASGQATTSTYLEAL
jgi:hypothetical protein